MSTVLTVLLWLGWALILMLGAIVTLFMTAFGDEQRTSLATRRAITPAMLWIVFPVALGGWHLMTRGQWWSIPVAYSLAASPPVFLYALISLLLRLDRRP